jgi:hypothetical protein
LVNGNTTLLYNVSLARLTKSIYLKKATAIPGALRPEDERIAIGSSYNYRGNKWFVPFGTDIM